MTIHSALSQPWLMTIDGFQSMRRDAVDRASKLKENDYKPVSFLNFDSFIDSTPKASGGVGVISINGPLVKSSNLFSMLFGGTTSYEDIEAQIRNMASDDSIKRIVLDIDSPGGQVAGLSDLVDAIRKTDKEVIAYTSGSMASAAYWIGSAADKIVAGPQAMVGSIGTVLTMVDYTELDKKIGIEEIEIVSSQSPYKRLDPKNDDDRSRLQSMVDQLADVFIDSVAENRGVSRDVVLENYGKGDMLVAESALNSGMVDKVGLLNDVTTTGKERTKTMDMQTLRAEHPELVSALMDEFNAGNEAVIADARQAGEAQGRSSCIELVSKLVEAHGSQNAEMICMLVESGLCEDHIAKVLNKMPEQSTQGDLAAEMGGLENPDLTQAGGSDSGELSDEDKAVAAIINAGHKFIPGFSTGDKGETH